MPEEAEWLRVDDLRTREDLERLHPHDYARLAAQQASDLDLLVVKLECAEAMKRLTDSFSDELQKVVAMQRRGHG